MAAPIEFVHVGYGGSVAIQRVLAIASTDSAPVKRMARQANQEGRIINLTYGRKAKTVIVLDSGHVVLAALQPAVILRRIQESPLRAGGVLDFSADTNIADSVADVETSTNHPREA